MGTCVAIMCQCCVFVALSEIVSLSTCWGGSVVYYWDNKIRRCICLLLADLCILTISGTLNVICRLLQQGILLNQAVE